MSIPSRSRFETLRFACLARPLNSELKDALWQKFLRAEWALSTRGYSPRLQRVVAWLNHVAPLGRSLLEKRQEQWELSLRSYLIEHGHWHTYLRQIVTASQHLHAYAGTDLTLSFFRQLYQVVQDAYDERAEYDKDIWDFRKLNIPTNPSRYDHTLNFTQLSPPWLQQAAKQYMRYALAIYSSGSCRAKMTALNTFAAFLTLHAPSLPAAQLDRAVILAYVSYLSSRGLSAKSRTDRLIDLRLFLELTAREGWAAVPDKHLIYDEDLPPPVNLQPRYIPQSVLDQLNHHLDALPPAIRRMVLMLQEAGLRISEVCCLSRDCLIQDAAGDWFLRWFQPKMAKEHSIPVSRELVAVIQEQQHVVQEQWEVRTAFLFPGRDGRAMKQAVFVNALNRVAFEQGICDTQGQLYRFHSHQFRHTVATRLINNGVPQHLVQRYLGHKSPKMTARYAFIHDQTMKEAYAKFRSKVVDVTGKVVEQHGGADTGDLQWLKKHLLVQVLPNGTCALPIVAGDCPHANACLTCVHFRTDARFLPHHRAQLQDTQRLLHIARQNGWQRQVEMNEKVAANLEHLIAALEKADHDSSP